MSAHVLTPTVSEILDVRNKDYPDLDPSLYAYKIAGSTFGLDIPVVGDLDVDEGTMSLWIPCADGNDRDGVGDLLDVSGISTVRHARNSIALFDHGKEVTRPIGRCRKDPKDVSTYTFKIDAPNKTAGARCFFYQGVNDCAASGNCPPGTHSQFVYELFDMAAKGHIGSGSVGYQVIEGRPLQPDYVSGLPQGLHLLKILLLEVSLVVLPANMRTVGKNNKSFDRLQATLDYIQKALTGGLINGSRPSPLFIKSFSSKVPERPAFMHFQKALKVPNYRKAEDPEYTCETCQAFQPQGGQFGMCRMFGNVGVERDSVCDRWTGQNGETLGEKSLQMKHGPQCKCVNCMKKYGKKSCCNACATGYKCSCGEHHKELEKEVKAEGQQPQQPQRHVQPSLSKPPKGSAKVDFSQTSQQPMPPAVNPTPPAAIPVAQTAQPTPPRAIPVAQPAEAQTKPPVGESQHQNPVSKLPEKPHVLSERAPVSEVVRSYATAFQRALETAPPERIPKMVEHTKQKLLKVYGESVGSQMFQQFLKEIRRHLRARNELRQATGKSLPNVGNKTEGNPPPKPQKVSPTKLTQSTGVYQPPRSQQTQQQTQTYQGPVHAPPRPPIQSNQPTQMFQPDSSFELTQHMDEDPTESSGTSPESPSPEQSTPPRRMGRRAAMGAMAAGTAAALGGGLLEGARRAGQQPVQAQQPTPTPSRQQPASSQQPVQQPNLEPAPEAEPEEHQHAPTEPARPPARSNQPPAGRQKPPGEQPRTREDLERELQEELDRQKKEREERRGGRRPAPEEVPPPDESEQERKSAELASKYGLKPHQLADFAAWKERVKSRDPRFAVWLDKQGPAEQGHAFRTYANPSRYGGGLSPRQQQDFNAWKERLKLSSPNRYRWMLQQSPAVQQTMWRQDQSGKSLPDYAWNSKSLKDLRLKWRNPKGLFHRSRKGTPSSIHMNLEIADLEPLRKDANGKGVEVHWVSDDGKGNCRVKLSGMDQILEDLAKTYAKPNTSRKRMDKKMKNLPNTGRKDANSTNDHSSPIGHNVIGTLPRQPGQKGPTSRSKQTAVEPPSPQRENEESTEYQADVPAMGVQTAKGGETKGLARKSKAADPLMSKTTKPTEGGVHPMGGEYGQSGFSPNMNRGGIEPGEYANKEVPEEGQEEEPVEQYGAQVLRRFHADAAGLLHEIDEMMELLENPKVKEIAVEVLQWLSSQLDKYENVFKEEFGGLSPLEGSEEKEGEEDEELEGGQSETAETAGKPATGRMDKEPTPDEALKGMQRQETGKAMSVEQMKALYFRRVKSLRNQYKRKQYGHIAEQEEKREERPHAGGAGNKNLAFNLKNINADILASRKHLMLIGNRNDPRAKDMRIFLMKKIKKSEELKDTLLHGKDKEHRPGSKTEKHGGMDLKTGNQKETVNSGK